MNVKVLMFCLYVTLINTTKFVKTQDLQKWKDFKTRYGKYYATPEEEKRRLKIFKDNLRIIEKHNKMFKRGEKTFKIGINPFTDMTSVEFSANYLLNTTFSNYLFNNMARSLKKDAIVSQFSPNRSMVPKSKNWVTERAVTPVKHQGYKCASCWAFSAAGVVESHHFIKTGKLVSLSDQNLLDCTRDEYIGGDPNKPTSWMKMDCRSGWSLNALRYVIENRGIATEVSYPYTRKKGPCRYRAEYKGATIRDVQAARSEDEDHLKSIVGLIGPVTAVFSVEDDFTKLKYNSGIYTSDVCGKNPHEKYMNHALIIVGYGTQGNIPYWLVKNSWGRGWGLGGYAKIRRGTNECQIAYYNLYPVI